MGLAVNEEFWDLESGAPLLKRNNGFVTRDNAELRSQEMEALLDLIPTEFSDKVEGFCTKTVEKTGDVEMDRIFYQDAVRTFSDESHRQVEVSILNAVYDQVQDYHQGLGFIVAFLSLFLQPKDVIKMCLYMNETSHDGYFKLHNNSYLRDARVFDKLLMERDAEVANHLQTYTVSGAFCSKWWIGMNLHVLPYESLFRWWQVYMRRGTEALFAFGLSVVERNRAFILKTADTAKLMEMLRFDLAVYSDDRRRRPSVVGDDDSVVCQDKEGSFYLDIVEHCTEIEVDIHHVEQLRKEIEAIMHEEEEARRRHREEVDSDDEIVFSDEEDD